MRRGIVLLLGVTVGCGTAELPPPPPLPSVDTAAVGQAIDALRDRLALAHTSGSADAFLAEFHHDVRLDMQGLPPIIGRAALDSVARAAYAVRKITNIRFSPTTTTVVSNDLALQGGGYVESYIERRKPMTEYGRYATSVIRGDDGQWRVAYWMAVVDSTVSAR